MTKEKDIKKETELEEFGEDLSPDDLDFREDKETTEEQFKKTEPKKFNK